MNVLASSTLLFLLLVGHVSFPKGAARTETLLPADLGEKNPAVSAEWSGLSHGRRDLLTTVDTCVWDDGTFRCSVTVEFEKAMLALAKNRVAFFVRKERACMQFHGAHVCHSNGCAWSEESCTLTADVYRAFYAVPCASPVADLIEQNARHIKCSSIRHSKSCDQKTICRWIADSKRCVVDEWYLYYNLSALPSGYPKAFEELFEKRLRVLRRFLTDVYESSKPHSPRKVLLTPLPPMKCPDHLPTALCEVVNARAVALQVALYCYFKHATEAACRADDLCKVNPDSSGALCIASDKELKKARDNGDDAFNLGITPSYLQLVAQKRTSCSRIETRWGCYGDCHWTVHGCSLRHSWLQGLMFERLGNSNESECKYLALDAELGCHKHPTEDKCSEKEKCVWNAHLGYCRANDAQNVLAALKPSGLDAILRGAIKDCSRSRSFKACTAVPPFHIDPSSGSNKTEKNITKENPSKNSARKRLIGNVAFLFTVFCSLSILLFV